MQRVAFLCNFANRRSKCKTVCICAPTQLIAVMKSCWTGSMNIFHVKFCFKHHNLIKVFKWTFKCKMKTEIITSTHVKFDSTRILTRSALFGVLLSVELQFITDVSGQTICPSYTAAQAWYHAHFREVYCHLSMAWFDVFFNFLFFYVTTLCMSQGNAI